MKSSTRRITIRHGRRPWERPETRLNPARFASCVPLNTARVHIINGRMIDFRQKRVWKGEE